VRAEARADFNRFVSELDFKTSLQIEDRYSIVANTSGVKDDDDFVAIVGEGGVEGCRRFPT